jgi:hypothetical protein
MNAFRMMTILLAAASLYVGQVSAAVPPVEVKGVAALVNCPTALNIPTIYHFDKIVFLITGQLHTPPNASDADKRALSNLPLNTELDIKVRDNPRAVANLKAKVLTFLGAALDLENANFILIKEVEYTAVLCPKAP